MKKFILFLSAVLSSSLPAVARENKNSSKRLNFELMEPVKLRNPLSLNWELEAGGPKHAVYKKVAPVVIKEEVVVEPVIVAPASVPTLAPVEEHPIIKETNTPVQDEKPVEEVRLENPVVNIPLNPSDLKEDAPIVKEEAEQSQTDKNIEEAKKLLRAAEKIANSVIEEEEPAVITPKKEVKPAIETNSEKPKFVFKFKGQEEDLKKADEKKIAEIIPAVKANEDVIVKIISYYSANSDRNIAFSRLLNARKVLLEKDVPTSQIMIMVLEDEETNTPKADTVEVFVVR